MVESIREEDVRKDWLLDRRINALKGEPKGGYDLKHNRKPKLPYLLKGAKRVRYSTGAGG
jgi:hypothetical protein